MVRTASVAVPAHSTVAVWGVKGGVGTTTLAWLLAAALARHQPGPVVAADPMMFGSLAIRAGTVLPEAPVTIPHRTGPALVIGQDPPPFSTITVLDGPLSTAGGDAEVAVVSATVDAVLLAHHHHAGIVALTHLHPRPMIDTATAARRLGRDGAQVVEVGFDPHLAVGGPISWPRLQPATRDAIRSLTATVVTALRIHDMPRPNDKE